MGRAGRVERRGAIVLDDGRRVHAAHRQLIDRNSSGAIAPTLAKARRSRAGELRSGPQNETSRPCADPAGALDTMGRVTSDPGTWGLLSFTIGPSFTDFQGTDAFSGLPGAPGDVSAGAWSGSDTAATSSSCSEMPWTGYPRRGSAGHERGTTQDPPALESARARGGAGAPSAWRWYWARQARPRATKMLRSAGSSSVVIAEQRPQPRAVVANPMSGDAIEARLAREVTAMNVVPCAHARGDGADRHLYPLHARVQGSPACPGANPR